MSKGPGHHWLLQSGASSPKECGIYNLNQADFWGATKVQVTPTFFGFVQRPFPMGEL